MKSLKIAAAAAVLAVLAMGAWAQGDGRSFQVKNRIRGEFDDNIYETASDQQESFKIVEELEFLVNLRFAQTFVGLRWRPTFVWWDDRPSDDTDFHNDADFILTHSFTPRLSISLKDTLRIAEQPELIDRGTAVHERDDYIYNVADAQMAYLVAPKTRVEIGGRDTMLEYDRSDAETQREQYEIVAAGLSVRQELAPQTTLSGELRYEEADYDLVDRGSESEYAGVGIEHTFSPSFLASLRAGGQNKSFNNDSIDDQTAPYFDGSVTVLPSPATRLTAGAGYSMFEAGIYPYANQERTTIYLSASHDFTARLSLYLAGSYQMGSYDADQTVDPTATLGTDDAGNPIPLSDGDETVVQLSARGSWKVNRSNWIEFGWQYLDLSSDLQNDFDRTRVELGWRTQI